MNKYKKDNIMDINALLQNIEDECREGKVGGDVLTTARVVSKSVTDFLSTNAVGSSSEDFVGQTFNMNKAFGQEELESLGSSSIIALVEEAGVPTHYKAEAAATVANLLFRAAGSSSDFNAVVSSQTKRADNAGSSVIGIEQFMPEAVSNFYVGQEAFGATSDRVISDLQVAITVSLLKWHNTITPRVLSNIPTTQPTVNYIREELTVYQLESDVENDQSLIDLYENPALVSNELTRIIPLDKNDEVGGAGGVGGAVVSDGILNFGVEARLLELGIKADVYGYNKYNRTDIVADGVKLDTIHINITSDGGTTESFAISIPDSRSRLTRSNNQLSTIRTAHIDYTTTLNVKSTADGVTTPSTELLAILAATGDSLVIKLEATPRIDIRDGMAHCLGALSVSAVSDNGGDADSATTAALTASDIELKGYSLDARYAEENMRKSNIATTTERAQLVYEIPQGRNYLLDVPLNGPQVDRSQNTANLYNVCRIGQDNVVLKTILAVLADVGVATEAYDLDPTRENRPGAMFAAGGRVRPTYIADTLNMTGIDSFDDARRQEAIQGRVLTYLNSVVQQIMATSFFSQQLDGNSAPTFRLITGPQILGNIVGAKPGEFQVENANGVELTLKMTSGVVLECVTSTFDFMQDKIVIVPFLSGDPASDLNFGHNRDFGTVVGSYTHNENGAAVQRLLANIRELPVPTNVIGAILDVEGIDIATFRADIVTP